jgi:hypothetical protein
MCLNIMENEYYSLVYNLGGCKKEDGWAMWFRGFGSIAGFLQFREMEFPKQGCCNG